MMWPLCLPGRTRMSEPARVPLLETQDAITIAPKLRVVPSNEMPVAARWWRIADFGVFAAWIGVVAFTLRYHEKWADEAHAWLIARDLDLKTIWFHELRYEGSPGLWHTILWVAQHAFHARYDGLGYIGMAGPRHGRSRAADFQSPVSATPSRAPRLHIRGCTLCHASRWGHSLEASHGSENNVTPLWGAGSSPDYGAAVSLAE